VRENSGVRGEKTTIPLYRLTTKKDHKKAHKSQKAQNGSLMA
jgi:hypothetical protein